MNLSFVNPYRQLIEKGRYKLLLEDIYPIRHQNATCLEDVIRTVAKHFNRNHVLMYAEVWNFQYRPITDDPDLLLGSRLSLSRGEYGSFTNLHGLQIGRTDRLPYEMLMDLLASELKAGHPVAVEIDAYWCPWNPGYLTYRSTHYCLVIGLDESRQEAICLDPNLTDKIVRLPFDHIEQGTTHGYTFAASVLPEVERVDPLIFRNAGNKILHGTDGKPAAVKAMRTFAGEIEQALDLSRETAGYQNHQYVPLFMILTYIGWARTNFASLFAYLPQNEQEEAAQFAADLQLAGQGWVGIKTQLLKQCIAFSPRFSLTTIREKVLALADAEEAIARKLISLSNVL